MIAYAESTGTPSTSPMDLVHVSKKRRCGLISQRHIYKAMVSESTHSSESSGLLTTTLTTSRDKQTSILSPVAPGRPDAASAIPESPPLSREIAESGGNTEKDSIVFSQLLWCDYWDGRFGRGMHVCQDFGGESLFNSVRS